MRAHEVVLHGRCDDCRPAPDLAASSRRRRRRSGRSGSAAGAGAGDSALSYAEDDEADNTPPRRRAPPRRPVTWIGKTRRAATSRRRAPRDLRGAAGAGRAPPASAVARLPGPTSHAPIATRMPPRAATAARSSERLRYDLPGIVYTAGRHPIGGDELIFYVLAGEPTHDEHDQAHDDELDTERSNLLPPSPTGQPDGGDKRQRSAKIQHEVGHLLEPVRDLLRRVQIVCLEDRDLPGVRRDLVS